MHYYTTPGVEDLTKSENFTYDQMARLSAAQTGVVNSTSGAKTWSLQWTYDRFGNRLTQSMLAGDPTLPVSQPNFTVNPTTNQIVGYCYDQAGNLQDDATCPNGSHKYAYDGANRLININTSAAVYSYFGPQRTKKVVGSTTTRYIYSGSKPIAEYVNGANVNSPSTEYIYAGSQLLVTLAGSATTYHHPDHLSNRAETNSAGTRTRTFGQLPFGETWYETGTTDKWKFTGYERDSGTGETGLDYANFRYYSAPQGRFMSADLMGGHMGVPQSLNRYSYTRNDPVNLVDPFGLDVFQTCTTGTTYWVEFINGSVNTVSSTSTVCEIIDTGGPGFGGGGGIAPVPVPGGTDPNKVDISELRERLWKALMSDPNCLAFLGINGAVSVLSLLDKIPIDVQTYFDRDVGAITEVVLDGPSVQNPSIHINSSGPFFPGKGLTEIGPRGSSQAQATIMFHELAHATNAIPRDSNSSKQSQKNSKTVKQKCKEAINAFAKK